MFVDARDLENETTIRVDVCIAGAGAAGITIARELMGSGLKVCLLEAGGFELSNENQALVNAVNSGLEYAGLNQRGRAFGGTTHFWAGMCAKLHPEDFEERAWMAGSGWPISQDDLNPFYRMAHRTCEVGAADYDVAALSERRNHPLLPFDSSRVETIIYHNSGPTRFGSRYRADFENEDDTDVYLNANLVEIELNEMGDGVRLYRCMTLSGTHFSVEAGQFCLALGGIENPRLLMATDGIHEGGLGSQSGTLGQFMEHPHFIPGAYCLMTGISDLQFYRVGRVQTFDEDSPDGLNSRIFGALSASTALRQDEGLLAHASTIRGVDLNDGLQLETARGVLEPAIISALMEGSQENVSLYRLSMRCEQSPNPDSRIRLLRDRRDMLGLPIAELNWEVPDRDYESYLRSMALIGAELGRSGLGRLFTPVNQEKKFAPQRTEGGWHHMGTTRMSARAADGVVDADCKVHGMNNLFVAGSSVFPTVGFVNPTLTIVALAHRLGQHLRGLSA